MQKTGLYWGIIPTHTQRSTFNSVGGASAPYYTKRAVLPRALLQSAMQVAFGDLWGCSVESSVPAGLKRDGTHNAGHKAFHRQGASEGVCGVHARHTISPKCATENPQAPTKLNQIINYYHI